MNALASNESKMEVLLAQMTQMARKLLVASNIETFSVCATPKKSDEVLCQFEQFVSALPNATSASDQPSRPKAKPSASTRWSEPNFVPKRV